MIKIAFIQRNDNEFLSIGYLSSLLKGHGHETTVFCSKRDNNLIRDLNKFNPDILAFSVMTPDYLELLSLGKEIKKILKDKLIVFGGIHPTFHPEIIQEECIDIICRGEGEYALLELADILNENRQNQNIIGIRNLWIKTKEKIIKNQVRPLIENLDSLPFPDREIYYSRYKDLRYRHNRYFAIGRGCPFECSYCFNLEFKKLYNRKGKYIRWRSPDNVVREIKEAIAAVGSTKWINFEDDIFTLNKEWLKEFVVLYKKKIGLPFICNSRVETLDAEMIALLKSGGCDKVRLGIEHGNEVFRKRVLNRHYTNQELIEAYNLLRKQGIRIQTHNIAGWPGETVELALETLKLNSLLGPDLPAMNLLQPYPGTQIYSRYKEFFNIDPNKLGLIGFTDTCLLGKEHRRHFVNLHCLFSFFTRHLFPDKLVKFIINMPPNRIYRAIHFYDIKIYGRHRYDDFATKLKKLKSLLQILFFNKKDLPV